MKLHPIWLAAWLTLATTAAYAEPSGVNPVGTSSVRSPCCAQSCESLHRAVRPLADVQPALHGPVTLESTISRSGVWDGALLFGHRDKLEKRLWWRNLTAKGYDSVLFRTGRNGTFSQLESQPSAYGMTLKLRF